MENWCQVRDEDPEIFKEVLVFQQPSAAFDEVLIAWDLEDLAQRFLAVVLQRDLLSGALTSRSKMAAHLLHILLCWVGPGMTPVVQLTDSDFSYILKRHLEFYKLEIARFKKEKVVREGNKFDMKFGPWETMYLVSRAARDLKKRADGGTARSSRTSSEWAAHDSPSHDSPWGEDRGTHRRALPLDR